MKLAISAAACSTSPSDTIWFGECMYRFGIDTIPVATPDLDVKLPPASVPLPARHA